MGSHSSKPIAAKQITVSSPIPTSTFVPPVYRDERGRPIQHQSSTLDYNTLQAGLDDMAGFLKQRGQRIEVITVGGAVNTLYLRSRPSTHDVDFFLETADSSLHQVIHEAARSSNRLRHGALGAEWFNNTVQLFMPERLQRQLFQAAVQQNIKIYDHEALIVYAVPWDYALCGKLNRLCDPDQRKYDIDDAVIYLHELVKGMENSRIRVSEIQSSAKAFGKNVTTSVLEQLDQAYQKKYGCKVIIWKA